MRPQTLVLYLIIAAIPLGAIGTVHAGNSTPADQAAAWLLSRQYPNGTYGAYLEHEAASAAYALYLYQGNSSAVNNTLGTLKSTMEDKNWWFWDPSFGEADIPGLILWVFAATHHINSLNLTRVVPLLEAFRNTTSGGYHGFYGVEYDLVNTVLALNGLIASNKISANERSQSISYLISLQTKSGPASGSFNMTSSITNSSFQSLAPDLISQTAIITTPSIASIPMVGGIIAGTSSATIAAGLRFLRDQSIQNSSHTAFNGQVFAASLSAVSFQYNLDTPHAHAARDYVVQYQETDGGFSDRLRFSYPKSDPLDTAWALVALQIVPSISVAAIPVGLILLWIIPVFLMISITVQLRRHRTLNPRYQIKVAAEIISSCHIQVYQLLLSASSHLRPGRLSLSQSPLA